MVLYLNYRVTFFASLLEESKMNERFWFAEWEKQFNMIIISDRFN